MILETKNLTKVYGKRKAVDNLTIQVEEGSIYGLLGPNGAGKTTTLSMLSTLTKPTKGDATIDGISITKEPNKIRSMIGLLPQDAGLYPNRTVLQHMLLFSKLKESSNCIKESKELISAVGLNDRINTKVKELSHGLAKLISIAQCFINNPKVVFLDEPITGLDPKVTHSIRKFIKEKSQNTTIIFSSHLLGEVEKICTHVGIINKGHLIKESKITALEKAQNLISIKFKDLSKETSAFFKKYKHSTEGNILTMTTKKPNEILKIITKNNIQITSFRVGKTVEDAFLEYI